MKIHIEEKLYLESDGMQFILKEYKGKQSISKDDGKTTDLFKTYGYFPSIHTALDKVLKMKIMNSTATDLKGLIKDVAQIREFIKDNVDY
ncbi:hypothetical protein [Paenibacillus sp. Marseille-Q4541]|uniref:hypothetical protein n=1 Tax=Paenibacillus sp. Marseille-Q4541 TaxID=2831522 RepID=UPI001BA6377F|nr:hypothetical protein [Paenibacillus sp. Marseille-Q4541]